MLSLGFCLPHLLNFLVFLSWKWMGLWFSILKQGKWLFYLCYLWPHWGWRRLFCFSVLSSSFSSILQHDFIFIQGLFQNLSSNFPLLMLWIRRNTEAFIWASAPFFPTYSSVIFHFYWVRTTALVILELVLSFIRIKSKLQSRNFSLKKS